MSGVDHEQQTNAGVEEVTVKDIAKSVPPTDTAEKLVGTSNVDLMLQNDDKNASIKNQSMRISLSCVVNGSREKSSSGDEIPLEVYLSNTQAESEGRFTLEHQNDDMQTKQPGSRNRRL